MKRQIYRVDAWLIDTNGVYHPYSNDYPKNFDSRNYGDDTDKAFKRADGDASDVWASMCLNDTRQLQVVVLSTIDGQQAYRKCTGALAEVTAST